MRRSHHWMTAAVVVWGAVRLTAAPAAPAGTELPTAPSTPAAQGNDPAAQEALTASEDVAVLKALAPLGLTRTQLSDLLPALQGAQAKLAELDSKEAAKMAAWHGTLEQARRDLLSGKGNGARASDQFALVQWGAAQKRASLRSDLVSSLQATLEKILTPAQAAQVVESGQAALLAQRMAGWRAGAAGGRGGWGGPGGFGGPGGPGGAGNPGGPGGVRGGGPGGEMDRVREMSPADFQQYAQRRAGRMGGESSPQFQQYMTFMNQVRDMPHSQYLLQRDQLAAQALRQGRGGFGAALAGNEDEATKAFVDRYLLSQRAPVVVRDRLRSQ
jgi:hypothetical protein